MSYQNNCTGCQTDISGNFGLEWLPNSNIQYLAQTDSGSTIGSYTIEMIVSISNSAATFTGPPDNSSGDSYLPITEYTQGLSTCQAICYCDSVTGGITASYTCNNTAECGEGNGNAPCNNSNPCSEPCNTGNYDRALVDPVYAYLESNPYNVMYPTAMVPFQQSVKNPIPIPNTLL